MAFKPIGLDERPDQLREAIKRGEGVTDSERYLAKLADHSFLNLWSYPSPFRDQKGSTTGDGKELCDLLVVCGRHVIIFSEKTISWPNKEINVAWSRWIRKAVFDSAKQIKGAERWIEMFPDRIFLDRECKNALPIDLPAKEELKVHRVLVAQGASKACHDYFGKGAGSLSIVPSIQAEQHWDASFDHYQPFMVGDLEPDGPFFHIIDEVALDVVLSELDTITDFTDYLQKREQFIRSGKLKKAYGEENLVAYYLVHLNSDEEHDFVVDDEVIPLVIDGERYSRLRSEPQYIAKQSADKISYLWDAMINVFTDRMLDGTSIQLDKNDFNLKKSELVVRYMALERRFRRRMHGEALSEALERGVEEDRFFRMMLPVEDSLENETGFFIHTIKYLDWMEKHGGYELYRLKRTGFSYVYARALLEKFPYLKRVIGISREPPRQGRGVSEDLIYAEQVDWTDEEREGILKDCETFNVLQSEPQYKPWEGKEYPELDSIFFGMQEYDPQDIKLSRQQRRALERKVRKRSRRKN